MLSYGFKAKDETLVGGGSFSMLLILLYTNEASYICILQLYNV